MSLTRCDVYDRIDGLGKATTVAELAARLKPILEELAYGLVNGEAAVNDDHEEWQTEFTDRMYAARTKDTSKKAAAKPAQPTKEKAPVRAPPINRPAASDIPASLLKLMEGGSSRRRAPERSKLYDSDDS